MDISKYEKINILKPTATIHSLEPFLDLSFKEIIESIRAEPNEDIQKKLKVDLLGAYTASGTFSIRAKEHLIKHSGLIAFDIDTLKADQVEPLKRILSKDPFVYACGISARGKGLCGLFKISQPAFHKKHFAAMEKYFLAQYKVVLDDKPKAVSSGRFYSYDPNPCINEKAKTFEYIYDEPRKTKPSGIKSSIDSVADDFNENGTAVILDLLEERGWKLHETNSRGNLVYTRPGKETGPSADYSPTLKLFHLYSSAEETELTKTTYNHFNLFAELTCKVKLRQGFSIDFKEAARKLYDLDFGNPSPFKPLQEVESEPIINLWSIFKIPLKVPKNELAIKIQNQQLTNLEMNQILGI